jgi:hypothetical protein
MAHCAKIVARVGVVMNQNPYDWTRHAPKQEIVRTELLASLSARLRAKLGCVLLGGRGMGKSVLLQQVEDLLERSDPSVRVIRLDGPPTPPTLRGCIRVLSKRLEIPRTVDLQLDELFDQYFAKHPEISTCVLLFDELDQYAAGPDGHPLGRQLFNRLESIRKSPQGRIGILAAGGLGIYVLRDVLGSAFMSRVYYEHPKPFTEAEIEELARPFEERGAPLSESVRKALFLASGGNPALVTYGLQRLWDRDVAAEQDVAEIYGEFVVRHPDFLRSIRDAVAHPDFSEAPLRVWKRIRHGGGSMSHAELIEAAATASGRLRMDLSDILRLLQSAGLIVIDGMMSADPIDVRATASILNLPTPNGHRGTLRDHLVEDLRSLLSSVYQWSPDFFRPGRQGKVKQLVPESVFTAFLGLGLRLRGWNVEREAIQGAGRTDLKLSRSGGAAVVEIKIWGRNDYQGIQSQVEGYWNQDVVAAAAVMIGDRDGDAFKLDYRRECLDRADLTIVDEPIAPPLQARFVVESMTAQGFQTRVDHLLLRIPRS